MRRNGWRSIVFAAMGVVLLAGCGRGIPASRLSDVVPITVDALAVLLVGTPDSENATRLSPTDKPLLQEGVYEKVIVAADTAGFAHASRNGITPKDVAEVQRRVVEDLQKMLRKRGPYTVEGIPYPPAEKADRTLIATLTPHTELAGSPEERAAGKGRTMVFIRLALSDAKTGEVLRLRDYYSGADARTAGQPFRQQRR
jgi:hypothetical protein